MPVSEKRELSRWWMLGTFLTALTLVVLGFVAFGLKRAHRREAYRGGGLESMTAHGPMRGGAATGFGEDVASAVTMVDFQRASDTPAAVHVIYYNLTSVLIERGILPRAGEPHPFPTSSPSFCPSPK